MATEKKLTPIRNQKGDKDSTSHKKVRRIETARMEGMSISGSSGSFLDPFETLQLKEENNRLKAEARAAQEEKMDKLVDRVGKIEDKLARINNKLTKVEIAVKVWVASASFILACVFTMGVLLLRFI